MVTFNQAVFKRSEFLCGLLHLSPMLLEVLIADVGFFFFANALYVARPCFPSTLIFSDVAPFGSLSAF